MTAIGPAIDELAAQIAGLTAALGARVEVRDLGVLDRQGLLPLGPAGARISPNGACRMFRAADGWMALNLARPEDAELLPAWLGEELAPGDPWPHVEALARRRPCAQLVAQAALLGLPASAVGEVAGELEAPRLALGRAVRRGDKVKVVDLTALWAGPLCGAVLAAMGAEVTRIESLRRPDPTRETTPEFFRRLNAGKAELALDLASDEGRQRLAELVSQADVLLTSARPRAFPGLGLQPDAVFAANPGLVWTAITGYGVTGDAAMRAGFGDDTAAAGGLVAWSSDGEPGFLGDALSDPVTGLAAAAGTLRALSAGGGVMVDAAMARCAAGAAGVCGLGVAA